MSRDWRNQFPSRRGIFLIGGGVAFLGLTARLAELQIFRQAEFEEKGRETRIRLEPTPAHRGTIYDRAGQVLAGSKRNFYVTLRPELAGEKREVVDIVERLAQILTISDSRKRSILQDATTGAGFRDILIADDLTWEEFSRINVMAPELSGVTAEVGELRAYPLQTAFYHTIGYVKKADDKDISQIIQAEVQKASENPDSPEGKARATNIKRLYKHPAMRVGKLGLEAYGENALKGEPGKIRLLQNAGGRIIDKLDSADLAGTPGTDVVLTLDAELQKLAIQKFGALAGTCVMIDVLTGEVLVMMSTPAPDPNAFVSGIASTTYKALNEDEKAPLYHKAYEGVYPPGSTFKVIVAAAALESGAMKPEDTVHCAGKAWYYNRFYNCYKPEGHGTVDMHHGIMKSCDCYFYHTAEKTGIEAIAAMAKRFGLGHRYELGLTGGKVGAIPNDAWKRQVVGQPWYAGDTISAGIGGGYVSTTPFQMAVMTSRIAGGPSMPNPHLVASGISVPDSEITPMGTFKPDTLDIVRAGMFAVTSEAGGTATTYGALDPKNELPAPFTGARMAGKSGTAQVRVILASERDSKGKAIANDKLPWKLRDHAHFVAYAPTDKPRYAVAITIEHGGSGSHDAAPLAQAMLAAALKSDPSSRKPFQPQKPVQTAATGVKPT